MTLNAVYLVASCLAWVAELFRRCLWGGCSNGFVVTWPAAKGGDRPWSTGRTARRRRHGRRRSRQHPFYAKRISIPIIPLVSLVPSPSSTFHASKAWNRLPCKIGWNLNWRIQFTNRFKGNRVIFNGKDEQWQADLVDVQALKNGNDGYRFLLTMIDVLSKYAWMLPLTDKTGKSMVDAFDTIFKKDGGVLERLETDAGKEFLNKDFQQFLASMDVRHFVTYYETNAQIVERLNRTMKNLMWPYFTYQNRQLYVEFLPALVENYNKAYHRCILTAPEHVSQTNAQEVWHRLYGNYFVKLNAQVRLKFKVGDKVRISKTKGTFEKGYLSNWTEEVFSIAQRLRRIPPVYRLKEYGTILETTFYERELQRVNQPESNMFRIEKILKLRGKGKDEEYLVRWSGWPSKYDQWLPVSSLKRL